MHTLIEQNKKLEPVYLVLYETPYRGYAAVVGVLKDVCKTTDRSAITITKTIESPQANRVTYVIGLTNEPRFVYRTYIDMIDGEYISDLIQRRLDENEQRNTFET